MNYKVKEVFYSLQGEGARTGRPAVFCRFTGCNLWNGKEEKRQSSVCRFCDTDFVGFNGLGGGKFKDAQNLAQYLNSFWPENSSGKYVVFTGGEPALQLDAALVYEMKTLNFEIAIETNGTIELTPGIDWVCVSPKGISTVIVIQGNELKLVYPQEDLNPKLVEKWNFEHFYLQPLDLDYSVNISTKNLKQHSIYQETIDYCLHNPQWKLSLQTHKVLKIR